MQQISHKLKVRLRAAFPHCFRTFLLPAFVFPAGGGGCLRPPPERTGVPGGPAGCLAWGAAGKGTPPQVTISGSPLCPQGHRRTWLLPEKERQPPSLRGGQGHAGVPWLSSLGLVTAACRCTGGPCPPPCPGLTPGPHLTIHFMPLSGLCQHPKCKSSNTEGTCPPVLSLLGHLTGAQRRSHLVLCCTLRMKSQLISPGSSGSGLPLFYPID